MTLTDQLTHLFKLVVHCGKYVPGGVSGKKAKGAMRLSDIRHHMAIKRDMR